MRYWVIFIYPVIILFVALSFSGVQAQQVTLPEDSVWGMAWNPASNKLAVGRFNGVVQIIDSTNQQVIQMLQSGNNAKILAVAWSKNGTYIAASNANNSVLLWNVTSGQLLYTLVGANTDLITGIAWNDASTLFAAISQYDGRLQIWNTSGQIILSQQSGPLQAIDWLGTKIALTTGTGVFQIDSETGQFIKDISIQSSEIIAVKWSPLGDRIATGNMDGNIEIWDANTNQLIHRIEGHTLPVVSVSWYPDGSKIASASLDGSVKVWALSNGQVVETLQTEHPIAVVAISPNGQYVAFAGASAATGPVTTIIPAPGVPTPSPAARDYAPQFQQQALLDLVARL
jgi:WD40 repeat protein